MHTRLVSNNAQHVLLKKASDEKVYWTQTCQDCIELNLDVRIMVHIHFLWECPKEQTLWCATVFMKI